MAREQIAHGGVLGQYALLQFFFPQHRVLHHFAHVQAQALLHVHALRKRREHAAEEQMQRLPQ